jgi:hypothetical protein
MTAERPAPDGLVAVLRRIAMTAALSGSLGLALYAGLSAAAGDPAAPFVIALLMATPLAGLILWQVAEAWLKGEFAVWRAVVRRDERPGSYWFNMIWYGLCGLALAALSAWCGWRLATLPAGA